MTLQFTKMHGAGNDFVVIDAIRQTVTLDSAQIRRIADRHFGVGCDQLLLVAQPTIAGADFRYRIFNADGGEVEQCGNGARCFMRFVHHHGLSDQLQIRVQTAAGIIVPRLEADGRVMDVGVVSAAPSGVFEESAVKAFRDARFSPAQKNGRPVRALVLIEVVYDWEGHAR